MANYFMLSPLPYYCYHLLVYLALLPRYWYSQVSNHDLYIYAKHRTLLCLDQKVSNTVAAQWTGYSDMSGKNSSSDCLVLSILRTMIQS